MTHHPLAQLFLMRVREFVREPGALFWVFVFPIALSLVLGIAYREQGPATVPVAVVDGLRATELADRLGKDGVLVPRVQSEDEARRGLQSGKVQAVVTPSGAILIDETQPNGRLVAVVVRDAIGRTGDAPAVAIENVNRPGSRFIDFLLPGIFGFSIMSSSIWGIGWALVQLRTRRLLKRFAATPMKRPHLLLSFVLFRMLLTIVETGVLLGFAVLVFDVHVQGSLLALATMVAAGVLAFAGIALLCGSRAENSETAGGLMNLATLPMTILSGVFFPVDKFPDWMQPAVHALPLTALNDAVRAIQNEGASLAAQGPSLLVLAAWAVLSFVLALKLFRWS